MSRLFLAVQQYQRNLMANPDYLLPEGQRLLSDRDLYRCYYYIVFENELHI